MPAVRGITVCVGEFYARTLDICLWRNMRHLAECLVVTAPGDPAIEVARRVPGVRVFETDAFYQHGAKFNKSYALELGFEALGRHGWCLITDADILLPDHLPLDVIRPTALYGAKRRTLDDPAKWTPDFDWRKARMEKDGGPIGYFQLFHCDDSAIKDRRPWYDVSFAHGGGGDAFFLTHWHRFNRLWLPGVEVLHLGERDRHWFGTDEEGRRLMDAFVIRNGWTARRRDIDRKAIASVGEIVDRVSVPGYEPSGFELPFVRRAQTRKP